MLKSARALAGAALTVAVMMPTAPASGGPLIPAGPDRLVFNWDFTGESPAPPYAFVQGEFYLSGIAAGSTIRFDFYAELDAGGAAVSSGSLNVCCFFDTYSYFLVSYAAGVLDGSFSVALFTTAGTANVELAGSRAFANFTESTALVPGTPSNIPEPAALALTGLGVTVLAIARRGRRHRSSS